MKLFLTLCLAAVGSAGLVSTEAKATETPVNTLPAVAHMAPTIVVETHRHHYHRYYHHRRYYWRHHRRYYY